MKIISTSGLISLLTTISASGFLGLSLFLLLVI